MHRRDDPAKIQSAMTESALIAELEEAGVTELQVLPWLHYGGDPETLDTRVLSLYRFADEFITNRGEDVA